MKQQRFNRGSQRFERQSVAAAASSSRREDIRKLLGLFLTVSTGSASGMRSLAGEGPLDQEPVVSKFTKLPSGTQIADLSLGKGSEIREGSRVLIDYVFRRADGYFVASTENGEPFGFTVGSTEAIPGLDEGIRGMRQGGTRRIVIPIKNSFTADLGKHAQDPFQQISGKDGKSSAKCKEMTRTTISSSRSAR
eukprot:CAMPEP_0185276624 /NCGR_PEP_ID=MMETSP1359-20130426/56597_1 /TAXON_ID=552665 /ORGANISM="Bigelowiella longifila, Strain CCMP242" /LENGTH=192 /DNA_ID=CAMNT_0027870361 /DNA_START=39 /DNA_END=618 /DNA_ORIENTATION=-